MKRIALIALLAASPAAAEDSSGLSLMERGAQLFMEGILREMEPAIEELEGLTEQFGPAIRDFAQQMGPALGEMMERIDDWSLYDAPEIMPNGDIIIRRKTDAPPLAGEIEI